MFPRMKLFATFTTILFTVSASNLRHKRVDEFQDFLEKANLDQGKVDVSELNILDEREGAIFCDRVLNLIQTPLDENLPFTFTCSCNFRPLSMSVEFDCATEVCSSHISNLTGSSQLLPLAGDFCMATSYDGLMGVPGPTLKSKVCSSATNINLNTTQIARIGNFNLFPRETISFGIPNVCASVEHKTGNLTALDSCSVNVNGTACPCEICNEMGTAISLNCRDLFDSYLPPLLSPFLEFTTQCISLDLISGLQRSGQKISPFINPLLTQLRMP